MITTKIMHNEYSGEIEKEIKTLLTKKSELSSGLKYLKECLFKGKMYIDSATNIRYSNIDNIKSEQQVYAFKFKFDKILNCPSLDKQSCIDYLLSYIKTKREIRSIERRLKFLNKDKISYKLYSFIIKSFNKKIVKAIIKGYEFSFGFGLSNTRVRKKKRTKAAINWLESNIEKQRLIDNGKIPFKVTKRDEQGRPLENNGGVKWYIYHISDWTYWYYWRKEKCIVANSLLYSFVPTGNNHKGTGVLQQLNALSEDYKFQTFSE